MDRERLQTLVRLHQAELYRYLRYLGADAEAAADLVQETFLTALGGAAGPQTEEPRRQAAWLRGIARNLFLVYCRRARSSPVASDSRAVERAEATWQSAFLRDGDGFETLEALRACLATLPEKQRGVLDLHYAQKKSRAEMGRLLRLTEDGIKSLLRRLRAALGDCIEERLRAARAERT